MANSSGFSYDSSQFNQSPVKKEINHPPGYIVASQLWQNTTLAATLKRKIGVIFSENLGIVDFYCTDHAFLFISESDLIISNSTYKRRLVKFRKGCNDNKMKGRVLVEINGCTTSLYEPIQKFAVIELGLRLVLVKSQENAGIYLTNTVNVISHPKKNPLKTPVIAPPRQITITKLLFMLPSIGEVKAQKLIAKFPNLKAIGNASEADLEQAVGLSSAQNIYKFFHRQI